MSWLATRPDAVLAPTPSEVLECLPRFMHEKEKLFLEWGGDPPWADVLLLGMKVDAQFRRLCRALNVPQLARDERFATNTDRQTEALEGWFRIAANIVATEPGALWTMRALRALPHLAHIRLESQRMNTDRLFEFYRRVLPHMDPQLLWHRLRLRAEFGWLVDELAMEEHRLPHDVLFREAARLVGRALMEGPDAPR